MLALLITLAIASFIVVSGSFNQRQKMRQVLDPFDLQIHLALPGDTMWDPRDRPQYGAIFHQIQAPGNTDCHTVCATLNLDFSGSWTSVSDEYLLDSASFGGCFQQGNFFNRGRLVTENPSCFDSSNVSTVCQCVELFLQNS